MKLSFTILIILWLSIGIETPAQKRGNSKTTGPVLEGFQISAVAKKELLKSGDPAEVRIKIKNVTSKALYLTEVGTEKDYQIRIRNEAGRPISLTEHGRVLQNTKGDLYMHLSLLIPPGQEREDALQVSDIYDMTLPGNYWIVVTRKVPKLQGKGIEYAESNTVHIKVIK